jgi:hypothetical protein
MSWNKNLKSNIDHALLFKCKQLAIQSTYCVNIDSNFML